MLRVKPQTTKYVIPISLLLIGVIGMIISTSSPHKLKSIPAATTVTTIDPQNVHSARLFAPVARITKSINATTATEKIDILPYLQRRKDFQLDAVRLLASVSKRNAITPMDPAVAIAQLAIPEEMQKTEGRNYVQYDPYVLEAKTVGDTFDILIPELGMTFTGTIETIETNGDIIRWQGSFRDLPGGTNKFSISQTMLDNYAVGSFDTSMGSFNLEAKNEIGWVINQKTDFHLSANGIDTLEIK